MAPAYVTDGYTKSVLKSAEKVGDKVTPDMVLVVFASGLNIDTSVVIIEASVEVKDIGALSKI